MAYPSGYPPMGEAPSVEGVLRPHISLPQGVDRLLSEAELDAVLIHEVIHARRRDNLIGLLARTCPVRAVVSPARLAGGLPPCDVQRAFL